MRETLDWQYLKGLYKLYKEKSVRNKLMNNAYIKNVLSQRKRLVDYKSGNKDIIVAKSGFNEFFEKELLQQYQYYAKFFNKSGLKASGLKKYDRYDLHTLMFIFQNSEELRNNLTTARIFSSNVFKQKDSKYLENRPGLMNDVLTLLNVKEFPANSSKENQWRCVIDCPNPQYILLCENLDFLKAWWEFYANNIELWYAGGNNIPVLNRISEKRYLDLPIYYVCDWDYHGLIIYERINNIFKGKEKKISLITPDAITAIYKPINSGNHKSQWKNSSFSGLTKNIYTDEQANLIMHLIENSQWIEEQTINPIPFIIHN